MNPFKGRHFQRNIILCAVRWHCKYGISYRELQEMLDERGVNVDHSTIYRWVQRYAPEIGVLRRNRRNFRRKELMYLYAWFSLSFILLSGCCILHTCSNPDN